MHRLASRIGILLFAACLFWGTTAALNAQSLEPDTPEENILKHKSNEGEPLWRFPLGPVYISEMIFTGQDTVFLGLKTNSKTLPSKECMLMNLATGDPLWRYEFKAKTDYNLFSGSDNRLILLGESEGTKKLIALDSRDGSQVWNYRDKNNQANFHAVPLHNLIILDKRTRKSAELEALSMETGSPVWAKSFTYDESKAGPVLFHDNDVLLHFFGGIHRISFKDGSKVWSRDDLAPGKNDPPPQIQDDTLFVSCNDKVYFIDLSSGETLHSFDADVFITNLFPLESELILRGELPEKDASGSYSLRLADNWVMENKVSRSVTLYRDDLTAAFILIAYVKDVDNPETVHQMMFDALESRTKGVPKKREITDIVQNPNIFRWQMYEGTMLKEKQKIPYQSVIGTIWDPEQKKAVGLMGYCTADLFPRSEGDIIKAFETLRFCELTSVADSWKQRASTKSTGQFSIAAISKKTGMQLWNFSTLEPTLSNVVEVGGNIYFGTSKALYGLEKTKGNLVFRTELTTSTANYPVHLIPDGDRIYYIGELIIAAINSATGKKIYSHGISPIDVNVSLSGLDNAIPIYTQKVEEASNQEAPASMNLSSISAAESRRYQNLANQYARKADHAYSTGDSFGYSIAESRRRQASNMARFESNMAFAFSAVELGQAIAQALMQKAVLDRYKDLLNRQVLFRKSIISSYTMAQDGDYVYRPHRKLSSFGEDDFTTVTVIHLPSGQRRTTVLSPTYLGYGLWNLVDLEKGIVYHHGIGLDPGHYNWSERLNMGIDGRVQTINTYLIAAPLRIPD